MQKSGFRHRLLASSMICGVSMMAAATAQSAYAQDAAAGAAVQEVIVTGSRIPQANLKSMSPVTAVSAAEIKLEGTTRIEDLLNNLPQVFASQGSAIANGSNGTATVDLRGLGSNRTLVLIDGKRVVPGDPGSPAVDLNNIPTLLVDRVEVDTGGASAVYGSDAVAGVVNFIMKKHFTGVQIDAQYSAYEHDNNDGAIQSIVAAHNYAYPTGSIVDGNTLAVTAIMGINAPDDKGNLTAYASYRSVQAITEADRDYTACTLAESGSTFACSGSGTTYPTRFTVTSSPTTTSVGKSYQLSGSGATTSLIPYSSATGSYNYGPINYLQRPDTNYHLGAYGDYEINKAADVYTQLMFMDDDSTAQIAAGGAFGTSVTVPCNYPYLTSSELTTFCNGSTSGNFKGLLYRRNVEGGGRQSDFHHAAYRMVIGSKGELDKVWSYDASMQYGYTREQTGTLNYFSTTKIQDSLSNCTISPGNGCLPYNAFQIGGVTQAQLNYLYTPGYTGGTATEQVANLTFAGKLGEYGIKSPWAADGVGVSFGTEYRRENITQYSDAETQAGDLSGSGGAALPTNGTFDVYELFGETRIPVVQDLPFAKSVDLHLAYRYSDYSTAGTTGTYAIEAQWAPVKDIMFRASDQKAVRAPNVLELFSPQVVGLANYTDPCGGTKPTYTLAQCQLTGMTAAQYGSALNVGSSANQNNTLNGGNPNLKPEVANTYSAGVVFTPSYVPGLSLSVDYFNIFISNVIQSGVASAAQVLSQCATTGNAFYCGLIHRDSTFGSLGVNNQGYISASNVNAGSLATSGVDITGAYRLPLSKVGLDHFGSVNFNFVGTYLASLQSESIPGSGQKFDCAGYYGQTCGTPNPVWRNTARVTWNTPWLGAQISGAWRYFGSVKVDLLSSNPLLNGSIAGAIPDQKFGAQSYFDLTANVKLYDKYTLRAGVNNVFDSIPPIAGSDECPTGPCNGNVFGQVYDSLGRYIFVGITAAY